jgi:hypothetical protein
VIGVGEHRPAHTTATVLRGPVACRAIATAADAVDTFLSPTTDHTTTAAVRLIVGEIDTTRTGAAVAAAIAAAGSAGGEADTPTVVALFVVSALRSTSSTVGDITVQVTTSAGILGVGDLGAPRRPGAYRAELTTDAAPAATEIAPWSYAQLGGAVIRAVSAMLGIAGEGGTTDARTARSVGDPWARTLVGLPLTGALSEPTLTGRLAGLPENALVITAPTM